MREIVKAAIVTVIVCVLLFLIFVALAPPGTAIWRW